MAEIQTGHSARCTQTEMITLVEAEVGLAAVVEPYVDIEYYCSFDCNRYWCLGTEMAEEAEVQG